MKRTSLVLAALSALLGLGVMPAAAQVTRTFVSGHGSDSNLCSLAAPCRTFQHAHDQTSAGGEVVVLDAAGYGPVTIGKAITLTAIGIEASITTSATAPLGIVVAAGAGDVVTIRGITVLSGGFPGHGIDVTAAKSVLLRDCTVSGFSGDGIKIAPAAGLNVELRGVSADNNGGAGLELLPTGAGTVTLSVSDSSFGQNFLQGVVIDGGSSTGIIKAMISAVAAANGNSGVNVISSSGKATPVVMVTESRLANNQFGLVGSGPVQVFVDRTRISGSIQSGWQAAGASSVKSYANNAVNGNGDDNLNGLVQITAE